LFIPLTKALPTGEFSISYTATEIEGVLWALEGGVKSPEQTLVSRQGL